jgi:hypothetical protein
VVITEMRNTTYRQPAWYRYVAGFAGQKPVIVAENPYGGVVPELAGALTEGKGHDLFRMSLYEAAALGTNMSVPYGAWMGSVVEDSFWPPHELCVEIQRFLADHEHLYTTTTAAETAVVFSVESSFRQEAHRRLADNRENPVDEDASVFWSVCGRLSAACQPYDVVVFPDGELRPDTLTAAELSRYRLLVAPDCGHLTGPQADLLDAHLEAGGRLAVIGALGENLDEARRARILTHSGTARCRLDDDPSSALPGGPQVIVQPALDAAVCIHEVGDGVAVHVLRYAYDPALDRVPALDSLRLSIRLAGRFTSCLALTPEGERASMLSHAGGVHTVTVEQVPLYTVIHLIR